MSKKIWVALTVVLLCVVLAWIRFADPSADSVAGRKLNTEYLRDRLGGIVLKYKKDKGQLPEGFEEAHNHSGEVLPNRGDYFGRGLQYKRVDSESFYFHSLGTNGIDEKGKGDDLLLYYHKGTWSTTTIDKVRQSPPS